MSKVTKLSNDDSCLTWEVPVHAKLFQINPVVPGEMVKFEGTMIQKNDEIIKEVVFEDVNWYRVSGKKSDQLFFPMGNYFLKEW